MTFNPNRNPYVNECSIQTHTRRGRVRAWSESTTTSLLSSSDSLTSIRVGAPSISVSAARRPLPEIPAVQSPLVSAQLNIDKAPSVQRTCPSKRDRRKRSGSESRRNTLIYLSMASAVFSLFCLSLLAATFFRHGILPWDDVAVQTSALGSCDFCVGLLQASLRCLLVNNGISPSSSSTDEAIKSRVSERISSYPILIPQQYDCIPFFNNLQLPVPAWSCSLSTSSIKTIGMSKPVKTDLIIQDNGQYVVSSRSEVQMDLESCTGGKDPKIIQFQIYRRSVGGNIFSIAQSEIKACELFTNDNSGVFCLANVVSLNKGDSVYTTLTVNGAEFNPRNVSGYLLIVQLI